MAYWLRNAAVDNVTNSYVYLQLQHACHSNSHTL